MRKRSRQMSRRPLKLLSAEIQTLELRCLPAGTVTANISGGNITLNGDRFDNLVEVELTPDGVFVSGVDGTTIKFGAKTITDGSQIRLAPGPLVNKDLVINLKDGDDGAVVLVDGSDALIRRNLKIDTGYGEDFVEVVVIEGSLTVGNQLDIKLGDDSDYLLLYGQSDLPENHEETETAPFHVTGLAKISGGSGSDVIGVVDFSSGGNLQIETGHGDDVIGIGDALIGANLILSTGSGNDDVGIEFVAVVGRTDITTGSGDDRVGILTAHSEGNVTILLQQGNDTLAAGEELSVGEDAVIKLDGGNWREEIDTLAFEIDPESELAEHALPPISFEASDSPELAFDILEDVFEEIFDV